MDEFRKDELNDREMFEKSYSFACDVHKDQLRDEGKPYITHVDGILDIFKNELKDFDYYIWTIVALHDVLEDSLHTKNDLSNLFDEYISIVVDVLSKQKGQTISDYLYRMENHEFNSVIIRIKLADRLHNVRSLKNIVKTKPKKVIKYIHETKLYYLPLAKKYNSYLYKAINLSLNLISLQVLLESRKYAKSTF